MKAELIEAVQGALGENATKKRAEQPLQRYLMLSESIKKMIEFKSLVSVRLTSKSVLSVWVATQKLVSK